MRIGTRFGPVSTPVVLPINITHNRLPHGAYSTAISASHHRIMSAQLDLDSVLAFTIKLAQDVSGRARSPAEPRQHVLCRLCFETDNYRQAR